MAFLRQATGALACNTPVDATFVSDITAGSTLIALTSVDCGTDEPTTTVTGISDDVNGAWTLIARHSFVPDPADPMPLCAAEIAMWRLDGAGAGPTTVTPAFGSNLCVAFVIAEFNELGAVLDFIVGSDAGGTSHVTGDLVTTEYAVLLGGFADWGGTLSPYIPSTTWHLVQQATSGDFFASAILESLGLGSAKPPGTYAADVTTPTDQAEGWLLVAFAEAAPVPFTPSTPARKPQLVGAGPLGRGEHRVFVFGRGGRPFVGEVGFTSLTYQRRLDDKSTAQVIIGAGTKTFLGDLRGWKHELLIARDDEPVWLGPIHEPVWEPGQVTLPADDLLGWLDNRDIAEDLAMHNVDLATVFARLVHDSMERELSPGLYAAASLSGVVGDRSYVAAQHGAVGDALRSLGQAGVDYTCILRRLHIGALSLLPSITLTDDTLLSPKVMEGKAATKVTLVGATTASIGQPVEAQAGGANVELGLLEKTINDPDVMTHDGAVHYAHDAYAFLNPAPLYISGVLAPVAPVDMENLIPGMHVDAKLSGTDRKVDALCRLTQVDVNVRPSEQGQQETVAVTLVPVGLEG